MSLLPLMLLGGWLLAVLPDANGAELDCPHNCSCAFMQGRFTTDCSNRFLTEIPSGVSEKTMTLILDNNPLRSVLSHKEVFVKLNLGHLVELSLRNCQLNDISRHSLKGLQNLRILDLSHNQIDKLVKRPFREMGHLIKLDLSHNHLKTVSWEHFVGVGRLEELNLEANQLDWIEAGEGKHLINLKTVNLASNRFTTLTVDKVDGFRVPLQNLLLINNPWHCNCYLRPLVVWEKSKYLGEPPTCHQPEKLAGKKWNLLAAEEFACQPKMEVNNVADLNEPISVAIGHQFHLSCNAKGDPTPKLYWEFRSNRTKKIFEPLEDDIPLTAVGGRVRVVNRVDSATSLRRLSSITVSDVTAEDAGQYHCVSENPAAKEYLVFTVRTISGQQQQPADSPDRTSTKSHKTADTASLDSILIVLISAGGLLILIVLVVSILCYRRKSLGLCGETAKKPKIVFASPQSNGTCKYTPVAGLNLDGPNPIGKPPRTQLSSDASFSTPLYEAPLHIAALEKQHQRQYLLAEDLDYQRCCALRDAAGSYLGTDDSGFLESDQQTHSPNYATHRINTAPRGRSQVHFEGLSPSSTPPEDPQSHQYDTIRRNGYLRPPPAPLAQNETEPDGTKGILLRETEL